MKTNTFAPIILFCYNRPDELASTIEALKANYLSEQSDLYVFSDGPKRERDQIAVEDVRRIAENIVGFANVELNFSEKNNGLAKSVINGVTKVINKHGKAIVIEDDLITAPNFLDYMNQALAFYESNSSVFAISGYSFPLKHSSTENPDVYFAPRASSWGYGVWSRSWDDIDWDVSGYNELLGNKKVKSFFKAMGPDIMRMLKRQMNGTIDSWAVRWCFNGAIRQQYTVFPKISKLYSIGFSEKATHTSSFLKIFDTKLDL